jgi:hypothetical protein
MPALPNAQSRLKNPQVTRRLLVGTAFPFTDFAASCLNSSAHFGFGRLIWLLPMPTPIDIMNLPPEAPCLIKPYHKLMLLFYRLFWLCGQYVLDLPVYQLV